jgi:hypothetical protein
LTQKPRPAFLDGDRDETAETASATRLAIEAPGGVLFEIR